MKLIFRAARILKADLEGVSLFAMLKTRFAVMEKVQCFFYFRLASGNIVKDYKSN